jgi:hypothetical protein
VIIEKEDVPTRNIESRKFWNKIIVVVVVLLMLCGVFFGPWFLYHFKQALPDSMGIALAAHHR